MQSKKLSTAELYWYIIGGSIGSGLFVLIPYAIGFTGRSAILAVAVAAIVTVSSQSYNVIVASFFPLKGGDYSQVAFLSPILIAGLYGIFWLLFCLMWTGYATASVAYASAVFPWLADYSKIISGGIVTLFFAMTYFGTKTGAKIQGVMTIMLLAALALFVIIGLPQVDFESIINDQKIFSNGFAGFSAAIAMCTMGFQGAAGIAVGLVSEVDNSTKIIPKTILKVVGLLIIIYGLFVFVATGVLPIETVAGKNFTMVAKEIFSPILYFMFIFGGAIFSLLTSLMAQITVFKYPFKQLTIEGWFPKVFEKETKNGWPYVGFLMMYILTMIPLLLNISFDTALSYVSIPAYLILVYANLKCFRLPSRFPKQWKQSVLHMPMPAYYFFCSLAIGCSLYIMYGYCASQTFTDILIAFGISILLFIYAYFRVKNGNVNINEIARKKAEIADEISQYEDEYSPKQFQNNPVKILNNSSENRIN